MQIEVKSLKCEPPLPRNTYRDSEQQFLKSEIGQDAAPGNFDHSYHHARHLYSRFPTVVRRIEERLSKLEHKIGLVSRKRSLIEKRIVFEDRENFGGRLIALENRERDLTRRVFNVSREVIAARKVGESVVQVIESVQSLEDRIVANQSDTRKELSRLDVNAVRKAAELSLTREELGNLRKAVQALSVSASKLQEKSDMQQESINKVNETLGKLDLNSSIAKAENVTKELEHVEDEYRSIVDALPGNCEKRDGLTLLAPGPGAPLLASCRKGWIVVGRRVDGTVDFDRTWNDYATGFGSPLNEFWAGNEALHRLTRDNCTRLKIDLIDIYGSYWNAEYEYFKVDSEESGYRLEISGFSGNATDAMSYQNGMAFSAKDKDMDISSTDCAANYHGGWWFSHCQHANLNGRYSLGLTWYRSDHNEWMAVASAELSVQRRSEC